MVVYVVRLVNRKDFGYANSILIDFPLYIHLPLLTFTFPFLHSSILSYIHLPFLTFTFPFLQSPSLTYIHLPFLTFIFPFLHSPSLSYIHLPFLTFTFPSLHSPSLSYIHLVSLLRVSVYMCVCRQLPSTSRLVANYCLGTY